MVGVDYVPVALLGTQLVAGTNYAVLCEARAVVPDAQPYYAIVFVYRDLQGGAELLKIVDLDLGAIAESGKVEPAEPVQELLSGGGMNHCVLCEGNELVFVYENLEGRTEVTARAAIDLGALMEAEG